MPFDELKRELQEGTPQTFVEGGARRPDDALGFFAGGERDRDDLDLYETIYREGGPIAALVDTRALMTFGVGAEFQSEADETVLVDGELIGPGEWLNRQLPQRDNLLVRLGTQAYVYGDALAELVETRAGDFSHVKLVNPKTMEPEWDEKGQLEGWLQHVRGERGREQTQKFDADAIAHVALHRLGRKPLGTSLIERNMDEIRRYARTQQALANALERHGFPTLHVKVGPEGGQAIDDRQLRRVRQRLRDPDETTDYTTGRDIDMEYLQPPGIETEGVTETYMQTLSAAFQVPEEMAGLGRGSTEATAKVRLQVFERGARNEQRTMGDEVVEQVARPILDEFSPFSADVDVTLAFEDVVNDQTATAEWLREFRDYYSVDEVRSKLGDAPFDGDEEELGPPEGAEPAGGGLFDRGARTATGAVADQTEAGAVADDRRERAAATDGGAADLKGGQSADGPEERNESREPSDRGLSDGGAADLKGGQASDAPHDPPDFEAALFDGVTEQVLWGDDADRALFEFDPEEVPEFAQDLMREAVGAGALFDSFETIPDDARQALQQTLLDSLDETHGWSITSLRNNLLEEVPGLEDEHRAETIARTETQSLVAHAREIGYERRGEADDRFYWVGPDDDRTTEACEFLKDETNPRHGGEPVGLEALQDLVAEANERFVDHDGRPWTPHIQCRHSFVRSA